MIRIESATNSHFKRWKDLSASRGIRESGEFILMGERPVQEFLRSPGSWKIHAEIVTEGHSPRLEPTRSPSTEKPWTAWVAPTLFKELDVLGTKSPLLVLEAPELKKTDLSAAPVGLEMICPLGDPANLGAVFRSALAFGVKTVILTEEAANPFHPKAVKASSGAVLSLNILRAGRLKELTVGDSTWALDMDGISLAQFKWPKNLRLLVGEEGPGVPDLPGLQRLSIPTQGVESLNAAVATAVALYDHSLKK